MAHSSQRVLVPRERVVAALEQKILVEQDKYETLRGDYEKKLASAKTWSEQFMPDLDRAFSLIHEEQRNKRWFRKYPEFSHQGDQFWFYRQPNRLLWAVLQKNFPSLNFRPCPWGGIGVASLPKHPDYPVFVPIDRSKSYQTILYELPAAGMISLTPKMAKEIGLEYGGHEVIADLE